MTTSSASQSVSLSASQHTSSLPGFVPVAPAHVPGFVAPPPFPVTRAPTVSWRRLGLLLGVISVTCASAWLPQVARRLPSLERIGAALEALDAVQWLPAVLVLVVTSFAAERGLREPTARARALLPLLGLSACPLILLALLSALSHLAG